MIIPYEMLSPEALHGVIEAFVTREGTDYGTQDISLAVVFQICTSPLQSVNPNS